LNKVPLKDGGSDVVISIENALAVSLISQIITFLILYNIVYNTMINFYNFIKAPKTHNPNFDNHRIQVPFRGLVCCASGGGKSNLVLNLLNLMSDTFHRIIIVTKASEPLYDYLEQRIKKIEIYYEGKIPDDITKLKEMNGLIIFDDLIIDKKPQIGELYIRGRKLNYSMIYISQSFFKTDKLIRQNCNYIFFGSGMLARDIKLILSEFSLNLSKDELLKLYNDLTKIKMDFMMIDLNERNIRKNILEIIREF
jgi:hypothetical protein